MSSQVQVTIHGSQFPQRVTEDLLESLRRRQVNHKFHYDSVKQAQLWLALHQACSPSRTQTDCATAYAKSFQATAARITSRVVHLIGLGCGGGQKDTRLLELLRTCAKQIFYTPCDVSLPLVLVALQTAQSVVEPSHCFPLVCDLVSADDLPAIIAGPFQRFQAESKWSSATAAIAEMPCRLLTFFGMIPNFEPEVILPRLRSLVRPGDYLLLSANLAPGPDYAAGVEHVLPQYENDLTREWLLTLLLDLGSERGDGQMRFVIEDGPEGKGLKRIAVYFDFIHRRSIRVGHEQFTFLPNDSIRLFFSYRHNPARLESLLAGYGLQVLDQWINSSEEEGIFLVQSCAG